MTICDAFLCDALNIFLENRAKRIMVFHIFKCASIQPSKDQLYVQMILQLLDRLFTFTFYFQIQTTKLGTFKLKVANEGM